MPEHKLDNGKIVIDGIRELGKILEYHVQLEQPVESDNQQSPAIDLAWVKEKNQKFPLFIFEIESSATNGMTYNPMKVFSKKNEKFEKPLFFFQVLVKGGETSSRIKDLKETYGTYNYRIYRIKTAENQQLLFDILEQHRRISQKLDIVKLFDYLLLSDWLKIDLIKLSTLIENLDFEKESGLVLNSYVSLASRHKILIPIVSSYLRKIHIDFYSNQSKVIYNTYIGSTWCFPIHLGIINSSTNDLYLKDKAARQLKYWQENNTHLTMIGPHFGLSQDYDEFLIWGAGGLFGILSALFNDNNNMRMYFANQLKKIIEKTNPKYRIPNLLWLLHIIPSTDDGKKIFNYVSKTLKEIGNFSKDAFWTPPFLNHDEEFIESFINEEDSFFDFNEYLTLINSKPKLDKTLAIQLACKILTNDFYDEDLNFKIILTI